MNQSNANLETSQQNQYQTNSKSDNNSLSRKQNVQNNSVGTENNAEEINKPLTLAELFGKEQSDGNSSQDDGDDDPNAPVDSIDRLVKRHGLTPEQVYAIKVPMPNGQEPVTIGELKDKFAETADLEQRELLFEQRRMKREGELLRAQTELRQLLSYLPKEAIKPELVNTLRKQHETLQARERAATLEVIPEWEQESVRLDDIKGMNALLAEYGFDESFLTTIVDHRALKFVRDMYVRDKRIKTALAKIQDDSPKNKGQRPSGKSVKPAQKPTMQSTTRRRGAATQRDLIMSTVFGKK